MLFPKKSNVNVCEILKENIELLLIKHINPQQECADFYSVSSYWGCLSSNIFQQLFQ